MADRRRAETQRTQRFDADRFEEDIFLRAAAQPADRRHLSIQGCHILARQFRTLVEAHHASALARVGWAQSGPFDLHTLLRVPDDILALGSTHPDALAWLAAHWGITDRLRQVMARPGATAGCRLPRGHTVAGYGFFISGETPMWRSPPSPCAGRRRISCCGHVRRTEGPAMDADGIDPATGPGGAGEGDSPHFALDVYSGPLAHLLALSQAQQASSMTA